MIRKLILFDGASERDVLLVGTIVIGRDPACHITQLDPLLSRRHAEFVPGPANVVVRDLGSRNGILVNGERASEHVLTSGDVVTLGHLQVRYTEERVVHTPETAAKAHATTGINDAPTLAPGTFRPSAAIDLDDTDVATRAPKAAPKPAPVKSATPADLDATFAPGVPASGAPDPDATFAPGIPVGAPADLDATFARSAVAQGPADLDATFAPGVSAGAPADLGAALAPGVSAPRDEASLVAGLDLVVTSASPACKELLAGPGGPLVGEPLADVLVRAVRTVAAAGGPASLSCVVSRHSSNRTVTITFTTTQAVETVS